MVGISRNSGTVLAVLLVLVLFAGCGKSAAPGPVRLPVEALLDAGERAFVVRGETNLPDGAVLTVVMQGVQAPNLLAGVGDATVRDGRYEIRFPYGEQAPVPGVYQATVAFGPLGQNEEVLELVGPQGERFHELGVEIGEIQALDQPVALVFVHNHARIEVP